jgi:hypothetical protein
LAASVAILGHIEALTYRKIFEKNITSERNVIFERIRKNDISARNERIRIDVVHRTYRYRNRI